MSEPRLLGEILQDYFANSNEPLAVAFREHFGIQVADTSKTSSKEEKPKGQLIDKLSEKKSVNLDEMTDEELDALVEKTFLEDWIDNQDVMQLLHISIRTLQTLRSNGILPYSRINNKIYYRRQDIQKILADNYTMYRLRNGYGKNR